MRVLSALITVLPPRLSVMNIIFHKFSDISRLPADGPTQPMLAEVPKKFQAGFKRSFNREWYETYTWIEYSTKMDAAFCFPCRHFVTTQSGKNYDPCFTKTGFSKLEEGFRM